MGANQSKTPLANEKLLIERLRALEIKDQADTDYVHIHEKDIPSKRPFKSPWTNLSISDVAHWEHELLQDPKNRSVPNLPASAHVPFADISVTDWLYPPSHRQILNLY